MNHRDSDTFIRYKVQPEKLFFFDFTFVAINYSDIY